MFSRGGGASAATIAVMMEEGEGSGSPCCEGDGESGGSEEMKERIVKHHRRNQV